VAGALIPGEEVPVPPLTTWRCDRCTRPIQSVAEGYVVWQVDADPYSSHDFLIIHQGACDPGPPYTHSYPLEIFLGPDGLAMLLSWVADAGYMRPERESAREVRDLEEWADLVRRVQTPWYEEARLRLRDPDVQLELADANEYLPYTPDILERIAKEEL
jgi:hypothetical protein